MIYIPGVENVTVTDNLTDSTNDGGIVIGEDSQSAYYFAKTGPASGITIRNNVVNNALGYGYPTVPAIEDGGAIFNYVANQNYVYVTTTPEADFTITGNLVTHTPRSGIRAQNVNGGSISGNTILNYAQAPNSYLNTFSAGSGETLQQIEADFAQPIVIARSTGVTNANNVTTGSIITSVSDASGGLRLAPGAIASAYGANLASTIAGSRNRGPSDIARRRKRYGYRQYRDSQAGRLVLRIAQPDQLPGTDGHGSRSGTSDDWQRGGRNTSRGRRAGALSPPMEAAAEWRRPTPCACRQTGRRLRSRSSNAARTVAFRHRWIWVRLPTR